jgi:hypothetical protein
MCLAKRVLNLWGAVGIGATTPIGVSATPRAPICPSLDVTLGTSDALIPRRVFVTADAADVGGTTCVHLAVGIGALDDHLTRVVPLTVA